MSIKSSYTSGKSRDYYKGTSFDFSELTPNTHYTKDDYIIDFVSFKGCLLACKISHKSPLNIEDSKYIELIKDGDQTIGIKSNYWTFVMAAIDCNSYTKEEINSLLAEKVDITRKINGYNLDADIELDKNDIGLSEVVNTADSATPEQGGIKKFTTGGAYIEFAKKQDVLVSGENIKTINNNSILGEGNISVGTYSKPSTGIPKSDLEQSLQESINNSAKVISTVEVPVGSTLKISITEDCSLLIVGKNPPIGVGNMIANLYASGEYHASAKDINGIKQFLYNDNGIVYLYCDGIGNYYLRPSDETTFTVILLSGAVPTVDVSTYIPEHDEYDAEIIEDYQKPSNGIPKSDLTSSVQDSLGKADTSLQPSDLTPITERIPNQTYLQDNELADKFFVNSSIQTATATFQGNWDTWKNVPNVEDPEFEPDKNDYLVVRDASGYAPLFSQLFEYSPDFSVGDICHDVDEFGRIRRYKCIQDVNYEDEPTAPTPGEDSENIYWEKSSEANQEYEGTWRFKYVPVGVNYNKYNWLPEYQVNEKPLTAAQLAALNSGITEQLTDKLAALPNKNQLDTQIANANKVFIAEYGVTSASKLLSEYNAGKVVVLLSGGNLYQMSKIYISSGEFAGAIFSCILDTKTFVINVAADGTWGSNTTYNFELTANKVTAISSSSTDTQYASAKCLYDNLLNYYLKSETYTRQEVNDLIGAVSQFTYEAVSELPTASADTMRKIYLVPSSDPQSQNVKDEYITIDNGADANPRYTWEQIGSTAIDLSGYQTTANLATQWGLTPSDTKYPSEKLVKDSVDAVDKFFVAQLGITTNQEVLDALNSGKIPVLIMNDGVCVCMNATSYGSVFSQIRPNEEIVYYYRIYADGSYTTRLLDIESKKNKVSAWQSTPNDSKYPTEKLVYDSLDAKANKDGDYPEMTVGLAENLSADKIQVTTPYTLKATAHDPSQPELEVADGPVKMIGMQGRAIAWNQLVAPTKTDYNVPEKDNSWGTFMKFGDSEHKFDLIQGHKYMSRIRVTPKTGSLTLPATTYLYATAGGGGYSVVTNQPTNGTWFIWTMNRPTMSQQYHIDCSEAYTATAGTTADGELQLYDLTLLCPHLASKADLTVAEVEAYLTTCHTERPYWEFNAGQLLGARGKAWIMPKTKNLLNPTTKKAELFTYAYTDHDNEYTVIGWDNLTGAALQFTPYKTGIAEVVTLDANNRFVIPSAGVLEVIEAVSGTPIVGDVSSVCVNATYDGSEDGEGADFELSTNEFDTANIYHKEGNTYTQVFDGGVMRATGDGADAVRDEIGFDESTKKCFANKLVGDVDFGNQNFNSSVNLFVTEISDIKSRMSNMLCSKYSVMPYNVATSDMTDKTVKLSSIVDAKTVFIKDSNISSTDIIDNKIAKLAGVHLFYELATPTIYTSELYYKTGENTYVPLEEVFPREGKCSNWASEKQQEQELDANNQPQSIVPITTEDFTTDYKELLKTIGDTYISKEELKQTTGDSTKIPMSQKAVSDALDELYKRGVISQTQTWTQAQDGGYDYVMSDLVYGNIPQANIDLFVAAGATFNTTTGYFELNGLTDISYEEMQKIYEYYPIGLLNISSRICLFNGVNCRTITINISETTPDFNQGFRNSMLETVNFNYNSNGKLSNMASAFSVVKKIRNVGVLECSAIIDSNKMTNIFYYCYSLVTANLEKLKVNVSLVYSPRLSLSSLLYMINNEAATSAITITLHPTVYAKTQTGGEWEAEVSAALANHTYISLASA